MSEEKNILSTKRYWAILAIIIAVLLGGFGWAASQSQDMTDSEWNDEYAATVGLSNRFRICDALYANLDLGGFITKDEFRHVNQLLEKEGIEFESDGTIDLKKYGWFG